MLLGSETVGDVSPKGAPPYPSPPDCKTEGIFRPAIFWNPRSLLDERVLSVRVVWFDCRQRFTNAGAKYEAVKSGSLLDRREAISADRGADSWPAAAPVPSLDGRPRGC
jgi:hypothetical protein